MRRIQIKVKFPCDNIIVSLAHNWVKFYTSTRKHEQREREGKKAIQSCTSMMPMLSTRYGENIKNTRHSSSSLAQVAFNYRNVHFSISSNWKSRLTRVSFALVLSFIIVKLNCTNFTTTQPRTKSWNLKKAIRIRTQSNFQRFCKDIKYLKELELLFFYFCLTGAVFECLNSDKSSAIKVEHCRFSTWHFNSHVN